mgnify:CR=1 FL=1
MKEKDPSAQKYDRTATVSDVLVDVTVRSWKRWDKDHHPSPWRWRSDVTGEPSGYRDPDNANDRRCKHGTFLGHEWGPDYLCGPCEDVTTDSEWENLSTIAFLNDQINEWQELVDDLIHHLPEQAFKAPLVGGTQR